MHKAYEGSGGKRGPVTLQPKGGGGYKVLDGNSTVAIAKKNGWKNIPANILRTPKEVASFHESEAEKKRLKAAKLQDKSSNAKEKPETSNAEQPKSESGGNELHGTGSVQRGMLSPGERTRSSDSGSPAERLQQFKQQAIPGRETNIRLPGGQKLKAKYAVVDSDDLTPSHDPRNQFQKNEFGDINERPYHDPHEGRESRATVERIANDKDFELLHTDTPTAVDGPPIVSDEGVVCIGGNARTMGQQLTYHRAGESAGALRKSSLEALQKFGIDPKSAEGIKNPVIVRMVEGQHERGQLSRVLNEALSAGKSSATEAVSRANKVSEATADRIGDMLSGDDAPTIREVLGNPDSSAKIISGFMRDGAWNDTDLTKFTEPKTGALNDEGKAVVERMLVGRLIDDPGVLANATPQAKNRVMAALPELLRATQKDPKVKKWLFDAVASYGDFKSSGLPLEDFYFRQQSMMPPPGFGNRQVATIAGAMDTMGPKKFREASKELLDGLGVSDPSPGAAWVCHSNKGGDARGCRGVELRKEKGIERIILRRGWRRRLSRLRRPENRNRESSRFDPQRQEQGWERVGR